jgi:hypothetical protein
MLRIPPHTYFWILANINRANPSGISPVPLPCLMNFSCLVPHPAYDIYGTSAYAGTTSSWSVPTITDFQFSMSLWNLSIFFLEHLQRVLDGQDRPGSFDHAEEFCPDQRTTGAYR